MATLFYADVLFAGKTSDGNATMREKGERREEERPYVDISETGSAPDAQRDNLFFFEKEFSQLE